MIRTSVALALLLLALLLAAVAWVLARPRWRWEPPTEVEPRVLPYDTKPVFSTPPSEFYVGPGGAHMRAARELARYSTGSPWSVTSRADNGTGLFV